jgi:hypothetical protein
MISGRIIVHDEPLKSTYNASNTGWNRTYGYGLGGDEEDVNYWMREAYKPTYSKDFGAQALLTILNRATCDGFVEGARVGRASGNPGIGTIVKIHRDLNMAYDEDTREFTAFKVTWDVSPIFVGGTFDYTIEDLVLISTPLPPLLEHKDETLSNIPFAC